MGGDGVDPALQQQEQETEAENKKLQAQEQLQNQKTQEQALENMRRMRGGSGFSGSGGNSTLG